MSYDNKVIEVGWGAALRILQVKKLFKGLKCRCCVNKGYTVILEDTVYTWDDLQLQSNFESHV